MIYYRDYIADYLRDTVDLTLIEHGAYGMMMRYYYADEKPLPLEIGLIYRRLRAMSKDEQHAINKVLALYFEKQIDGYHQKRIDREIHVSHQARDNGAKGGRKRTGSTTEDETGNVTGQLTGLDTGSTTEDGAGSGHPSSFNLQPSTGSSHPSTVSQGQPISGSPPARGNGSGRTVETWNAFSKAYQERYEIEPIRNAKVNGQLGKLIDQVGIEEAPKVAAFYLTHNGQLYVSSGHAVDLLLRDCQKLRTEMLTGRRVTTAGAKQAEKRDDVREQAARVGRLLGHPS